VNYDEETLMAFADGELDAATQAEISAAMARDPELARRVATHRALRTEVAGAFATVIDQPVPEKLLESARNAPRAPGPPLRGNVVKFPSRGSRAPSPPWRAREWMAMAASLVLGGLLSWQFMVRSGGDIAAQDGGLVARGGLAQALDTQLASNQPADAAVRIGLSFKATDGAYCRSFVAHSPSTAGLACRAGGQWRIDVASAVDPAGGGLRPAATLPPAIVQAIEARMGGEALDAAGETAARDAGWVEKTPASN
jgi:hypothetical protein